MIVETCPKVSVCVPSYNHRGFIQACLHSVLSQDYPNFEVLVRDDCSHDGTWEYLQTIRDRKLRIERNPERKGITNNWNMVVGDGDGSLIIILPSDDVLMPNHIRTLSQIMVAKPNLGFVGTAVDFIHPSGESVGGLYRRGLAKDELRVYSGSRRVLDFMFGNKMTFSGTMFRRSIYESVGGFDEAMVICEDWDFWARCLRVSDEGFLNTKLVQFRWHAQNTSGIDSNKALHYIEAAMVINRISQEFKPMHLALMRWPAFIYLLYRVVMDATIPKEDKRYIFKRIRSIRR